MRMLVLGVLAIALVGLGWTLGTAQTRGDFDLRVDASSGTTVVTCLRGCTLTGWRGIDNPRAGRMQTYEFSCEPPAGRCTGRVVGFIAR